VAGHGAAGLQLAVGTSAREAILGPHLPGLGVGLDARGVGAAVAGGGVPGQTLVPDAAGAAAAGPRALLQLLHVQVQRVADVGLAVLLLLCEASSMPSARGSLHPNPRGALVPPGRAWPPPAPPGPWPAQASGVGQQKPALSRWLLGMVRWGGEPKTCSALCWVAPPEEEEEEEGEEEKEEEQEEEEEEEEEEVGEEEEEEEEKEEEEEEEDNKEE